MLSIFRHRTMWLNISSHLTDLLDTLKPCWWTGTGRTWIAKLGICSAHALYQGCGMAGPVMGPTSQLHHSTGGWHGPIKAGRGPVQGPGHIIRAWADGIWVVTFRGSWSNWDLLWLWQEWALCLIKRFYRIRERTESSAGNVFQRQRLA